MGASDCWVSRRVRGAYLAAVATSNSTLTVLSGFVWLVLVIGVSDGVSSWTQALCLALWTSIVLF